MAAQVIKSAGIEASAQQRRTCCDCAPCIVRANECMGPLLLAHSEASGCAYQVHDAVGVHEGEAAGNVQRNLLAPARLRAAAHPRRTAASNLTVM